jgi:hypothetical protein
MHDISILHKQMSNHHSIIVSSLIFYRFVLWEQIVSREAHCIIRSIHINIISWYLPIYLSIINLLISSAKHDIYPPRTAVYLNMSAEQLTEGLACNSVWIEIGWVLQFYQDKCLTTIYSSFHTLTLYFCFIEVNSFEGRLLHNHVPSH